MQENLPKRKNIRLKYYDYSKEGYYFRRISDKIGKGKYSLQHMDAVKDDQGE